MGSKSSPIIINIIVKTINIVVIMLAIFQVSSNEETIDNLDKQLADSKITLSDSENKFDDISRKLVRNDILKLGNLWIGEAGT